MINSKELLNYTKNLSIIFAEDHDDLRENTTDILKNFFKEVDSAKDGQQALEMYNEFYQKNGKHYDLVLSDIQMPKLDGIELTKKLYEINSSQMIIILSAFDDTHYLLPLINLGIEQFIKKPVDYQEFLKTLLSSTKKLQLIKTSTVASNQAVQLNSAFRYEKNNGTLFNNNKSIYLTKYEIIFMKLLTSEVGKIYSNNDIVNNYTEQNESMEYQNIRKLVSKLRKKLPKGSLESIYGVGYRILPYYPA